MSMASNIKYNEALLKQYADILQECYMSIHASNDTINSRFDLLDGIWQGDAYNDFKQKVDKLKSVQEVAMIAFEGCIEELEKVVGIYTGSSKTVKQKNESLPTEGIFSD